jgi:hypothetical protein
MSVDHLRAWWKGLPNPPKIVSLVGVVLLALYVSGATPPQYQFLGGIVFWAIVIASLYYAAKRGKARLFMVWLVAIFSFGYLLPWAIAYSRKHPDVVRIFLVNLLLGWTVIGWVVALVWSVQTLRQEVVVAPQLAQPPPPQTIHVYHHAASEPSSSVQCRNCGAPGKLPDRPCRYCNA